MLAVGEYNTLSVVFIVMFFGLSVDFAIHFSLRYQEAVNIGVVSPRAALGTATRSVGGAIAICTLTTALGFLGFVPTAYKGLADLGIISAGGMFIAAFLAFTLLPAFYTLCGRIRSHKTDLPSSEKFVVLLVTNRSVVVGAIALLSVGALMFAARAEFDYSVLALKDENAESMVALRRLQSEKLATDYVLHVLTDRPLEEAALEELTMVDSVVTRLDYVPSDQDEKLYIIEDLNALLYSALDPARKAAAPGVADLRHHTTVLLEVAQSYNVAGRYDALIEALTGLKVAGDAELLAWQRGMVANLEDELDWLRRALDARAIVFEDLPPDLRERLVGNTGQHLSVVLPQENVARVETLSRFIEDVRSVAPRATGRPVIEWGVGDIVVTSFQQALVFALVSILLVLLIMFRKVRWALMIAIPLTLSALFTLAFGVLLDAPLNMANILVLPLIFGLGVDNGIHVVDRYRSAGDVEHLMHSSTPRAVLLSTLTTVGTFAALSFSPHQGMASIGVLLTVAVAMLLFFAIFLLPVLLSWLEPRSPLVERAM
tara:strand:- start:989 stop:2620 length:1632 start_codon:yes stop_codon:yes gene_type:complete